MLAFIHFWVGHWSWPFSPQAKDFGAAAEGAALAATGVTGGVGAVSVGVGFAVAVGVAVAGSDEAWGGADFEQPASTIAPAISPDIICRTIIVLLAFAPTLYNY
jgi:hypothetical protein